MRWLPRPRPTGTGTWHRGASSLFCGLALVVAGVALLMFVMRMLLAKATARDLEAAQLQDELSAVI